MLELKNVKIVFPDWKIENVSFTAEKGKILGIIGPSGCGKTTILRAISGIYPAQNGEILLNEKNINEEEIHKRNIGYIFQQSSLFTHLNVFENIAFGLKLRKEKNIQQKVFHLLELVELKGFEKKNVSLLSGGEQQRVSIARALAVNPDLLLLDEPFTALDAPLREKFKLLIKKLQKKTKITMIFVSHDLDEAFFLCDTIVVLSSNGIEQIGTPFQIFKNPKTNFVKNFISDYSLLEGNIIKKGSKNVLKGSFEIELDSQISNISGKGFINIRKKNFKQ